MSALDWRRANDNARMRQRRSELIGGSHSGRRPPSRPASAPPPPKLAGPLEVGKFWANRRGEAVIVALREYEGTLIIDMRRHYTAADGKLRPTSKGLALTIAKLPELAAALARAEQRARELGLLGDGESAS